MESISFGFEPDKNIGLQDFSRGFLEGARLYIENKDIRSDSGIAIIVGLISAFPEKINYQTLNKSPEFHQLCATGHVAVLINDYMDMQEYLSSSDGSILKKKIEVDWRNTLSGIGFCNNLPEEKKKIVKSYMAGITLLDDVVRVEFDNTPNGIIKAKEIENSISIVHCAAMVINHEDFGVDCFNLHEDVTKKQLTEKYAWLINGNPSNEVQRRLCGLFNIIMITQLIDDRYDFKVDEQLGIRNIYSSILSECQNNHDIADKIYFEYIEKYVSNSNNFKITETATRGNKLVFGIYKKMQYMFPNRFGGYRERLVK